MIIVFIKMLEEKGHVDPRKKEIQLGKTKIFMKEHVKFIVDELLEQSLEVFKKKIYATVRMWVVKRKYKKTIKSIFYLQNWSR
jgi:myosin heavy subunit